MHDDDYAAMIDQLGLENPCNCEHAEHWEDNSTHDHMSVPASPHWNAIYVGPICVECGMGHMADYLVRLGPHLQEGKFVSCLEPLTADELRMMFDEE